MSDTTKQRTLTDLTKTLKSIGLTQAWAARQVGITPGYLNAVSRGRMEPSFELLQRIRNLTTQVKGLKEPNAVS